MTQHWQILSILLVLVATPSHADDWPQWRGPTGDNHAAPTATAPVEWDETKNIEWLVRVAGRGHSSPTIVGNRIYLTTADEKEQTQSLLILDIANGQLLTHEVVHRGGFPENIHKKNTHASSTVASDGQRVFALFHNRDAAWVTAFDLSGQQLWQQRALGFKPVLYEFGFGSSPVVVDDTVIVASEYDGPESGIVALDVHSGRQRWKINRPQSLSYSSPARLTGDPPRLLISGNQLLACYDATTGRELWSTPGSTYATCGTMVWDQPLGLAFASGGYPDRFTLAVRLSGNHEIAWQHDSGKSYEQSMLAVNGYLYAFTDNGIAICWRATDGEEMWRERLGGKVSASPLLVDGRIYATNEAGTTFVFAANPEQFKLLGKNQLGDEAFATPTPVDGRLYHRFAKNEGGRRQEYLAAIGP